ncbi:hypothetical protein PsorP6_008186 [Peronosclerospora sorghi]|uniref:Uncharacterized protein n=1 Tax=Peronosclerospora sorghi TaxID=230839 RepID=A0ACC0WAW4_9STRA|nr:hypothetical protein PsorP6_008186 [Peronosclerospora sorghi]
MSSAQVRRWNIVETHYVVTRKSETGHKVVNNYRLLHTLGQGRFGKVKLCERLGTLNSSTTDGGDHRASSFLDDDSDPAKAFVSTPTFASSSGRLFAMKILSKKMLCRLKDYYAEPLADQPEIGPKENTKEERMPARMRAVTALDRVHNEIEIMRSLYHRNIVLLFEVIEAEDSNKLYLVLEYMAGGPCMIYRPKTRDFYSRVTGSVLTEELARSYLSDILHGLQYLHQRRICHRDIKPDNVLLNDSGRCHITDFGCAKAFRDVTKDGGDGAVGSGAETVLLSDTVGTYQFLAPECCSGEHYDPFNVDIWAVGVVLYIFFYGKLPFSSETTRELFDEIIHAEITFTGPKESGREQSVSREGQDLLRRLLEKDPTQRITIKNSLRHPWFQLDEDDEPLSF